MENERTEAWARRTSRPWKPLFAEKSHNPDFCCASVRDSRSTFLNHQCGRKPTVHYGSLGYCKQHDPAAIEARGKARNAKWEREWNEQKQLEAEKLRKQLLAVAAVAAIRQIAAGHNDPRALALEVLHDHDEPTP